MLEITDAARDKLKSLLKNYPGKCLRLVIEGVGWGGPNLGLALDEPNEKELQVINEIEIMVEDRIINYVGEAKIDYISNQNGEGFVIIPTTSGGSCSCS